MIRNKIIRYLFIIGIFYIALIAVLYFKQRSFIYFPDKRKPENHYGAEIVNVTTQDGLALQSWYFAVSDPDKPVILHFHGNGGNIANRLFDVKPYVENGYGVLLAEYRGYGGNAGEPSEQGFYNDGHAYLEWLKDKNIKEEDIILYGESIGSGTATQLATEIKAKGLILEAPFSSLVDVASRIYFFAPVKWLLKDRYMNIDKIDKIDMPLLILHGRQDQTIPFEFAQTLFDKAKEPKQFIEFESGNHNNLYELGTSLKVLKFMDSLEPINP